VIGVLDGLESSLSVFSLIMREVSLRGIYMESVAELGHFARAVETEKLTPVIDRVFNFEEVDAAYTYLKSQQHFGKVVVRVRD
jgi:NADPH:quinone reductase-like Zn-dependent oxidoreductase